LNEDLSSQKEKVSELQKEVEKTRKEGQELQRVKMMAFKENIEAEHKKDTETLENKYKDKINELRERNVQQLKKALNDQKEELESKASNISTAVKASEGQLEKTQALLNQRKAEIEKLTLQLDEEHTKVEQKESQVIQVQKSLDNLQKQLEEEKSRSQSKIASAEADKDHLEKDLTQLKDELNQLKAQISHVKQKAKIKKEHVRKKHVEEITAKLAELEDIKRVLDTTKTQMKSQIDKTSDTLEEERQNSNKKLVNKKNLSLLKKKNYKEEF